MTNEQSQQPESQFQDAEQESAEPPQAAASEASQQPPAQPSESEQASEPGGESSPDPETTIAELRQEIETLRQQLEQKNEQYQQLQNQSARVAADFENFRKRSEREKAELEQKVKQETLAEILPIVDNFERARTQIQPQTEGEMSVHKNYQGLYKQLVDSLKGLGVSAMRPEGQPFDPQYHEAVLREPSQAYEEGQVIEQLIRGYWLGDRVLRHASVKVAAPSETAEAGESAQPDEAAQPGEATEGESQQSASDAASNSAERSE